VKLKFYAYKNCDTCRKAKKYLEGRGVEYELIPIREQPPTKAELKTVLVHCDGNIRKLFNTSGGDYKTLNLKENLPNMTSAEAIDLLSKNGNLIKRPMLISPRIILVGFRLAEWNNLNKQSAY
jgi:Spx/MgsR family transcriptional regulator